MSTQLSALTSIPSITTDTEKTQILQNSNLFKDFTQAEIELILPFTEELMVPTNSFILQEDKVPEYIYIIKHGEVEILKRNGTLTRIATLGQGAALGEGSILDEQTTNSVSVRALTNVQLITIKSDELRKIISTEKINTQVATLIQDLNNFVIQPSLRAKLGSNIMTTLRQRLSGSNTLAAEAIQTELSHAKIRLAMGNLLVTLLCVISVYMLLAYPIQNLTKFYLSTTIIGLPILAMFAIAAIHVMRSVNHNLAFYGFNLNNWRSTIIENLLWTIPILVGATFVKWFLIKTTPAFHDYVVFDFSYGSNMNAAHLSDLTIFSLIILYLALIPLQEFLYRGLLQGLLEDFLTIRNKKFLAILTANLIFCVTHMHISYGLSLAVFAPGMIWGYLYSKERTLIGIIVSHAIAGAWTFFVLNLPSVF